MRVLLVAFVLAVVTLLPDGGRAADQPAVPTAQRKPVTRTTA